MFMCSSDQFECCDVNVVRVARARRPRILRGIATSRKQREVRASAKEPEQRAAASQHGIIS
jgi:hypothetical protein